MWGFSSSRGMIAGALGCLLCACATTQGGADIAETAGPVGRAAASDGAPDYARAANWLCLPDRTDACDVNLDAAVIAPDGTVSIESFEPAADPEVDCFYVYPTVSRDTGANSDLEAGPEEMSVIAAQFARFGEHCRTFAPLYRQVTIANLMQNRPASGDTPIAALPPQTRDIAYADVKRAWHEYLASHNEGRGVILIGHSQGTAMLKRLIVEEIEGSSAVLPRIISAYLVGFNVKVPAGATVGGEFTQMPLCSSASETGCIVAYSTFSEETPPSAESLFGRSYRDQMNIACVNPADPGSEESEVIDAYFSNSPDGSQREAWVEGREITQRFVKLPHMVTARCTTVDGADFLAIGFDTTGPRKMPPLGQMASVPALAQIWGLHNLDMHLAMGDLVDLARSQSEQYIRQLDIGSGD